MFIFVSRNLVLILSLILVPFSVPSNLFWQSGIGSNFADYVGLSLSLFISISEDKFSDNDMKIFDFFKAQLSLVHSE